MKKKITLIAAIMMIAVMVVGCGCQGGTSSNKEKVMKIGDTTFNSENSESVNPHNSYNGWACIRYGIGETLIHYTDDMKIEPWLADK